MTDFSLARPLPPDKGNVTQWFGQNPDWYKRFNLAGHNGIDYGAPYGTPILAAHTGRVTTGDDPMGYGLYVRVTDDIRVTIYGHMCAVSVEGGQNVQAGDILGGVGSTGNSTGNHLHFGLKWLRGRNPEYLNWVDPVPFRT